MIVVFTRILAQVCILYDADAAETGRLADRWYKKLKKRL
jgi:hypothetical protein